MKQHKRSEHVDMLSLLNTKVVIVY